LQPIDEQFLITSRKIDWSTAPNVILGAAVMGIALHRMGWSFDAGQVALFLVLFACGTVIAYSFLVLLTATSVWLVRNQSLFEMWWLVTSLMRYPREIFQVGWAAPLGYLFTFLIPVMLVVSVPAETMVRTLSPGFALFMAATAITLLWLSRRFFRAALRRYR